MWLILLSLLLCTSTAIQDCSVDQQFGIHLRPNISSSNGATFVAYSKAETANQCHLGCCSNSKCDTSFHTGNKVNKAGYNCFYFDCHGNCSFANNTSTESPFSVGLVIRLSDSTKLPDFSSIFEGDHFDEDEYVLHDDNKLIGDDTKVPNDVNISVSNATDSSSTNTADSADTDVVDSTSKNVTDTSHTEVAKSPDASKANITPAKEPTKKPAPDSASDKEVPSVTDKGEEKATTSKAADPADMSATETGVKPTNKHAKPAPTPKPAVTLPNEVPAVKTSVAPKPEEESKEKSTEKSEEDSSEEKKKEEGKESVEKTDKENNEIAKPPQNAVIDQEGIDTKETNSSPDLRVEIHVNESSKAGYTQKDIVFWGAVSLGSVLILFGLITIVRMYRNKSRRLYASLTDDYLINGMYSI